MGYLLSLSDLKKVIAVGTIFSIVATLAPASAQAIRIGKASGSSINSGSFNFDIVTVDDVTKDDESVGFFPEAIQNFNISNQSLGSRNFEICGNLVCPPGNVTVTRLRTDPASGNVLNLNIGSDNQQINLKQLQELFAIKLPSNPDFFENDDVVRYDVTFDSNPQPDLIFLIQSNDPNIINNLSILSQFTDSEILGFFPSLVVAFNNEQNVGTNSGVFKFSLQFPSQPVPEPQANNALLGVGVLGAVLLMKSNQRLKKPVEYKKHQL
ncbi:hypothetical protein WA1_48275 [Scytonema hofmannii PCC 7110]|uniref:Uncharacterized protein n=1 Tax=Scytonema hofmannii PCC 7110 TaxID=128403 RepID=A0A139WY87_9CYAN|nr:hypothetical protein [Scytonema hofmannii]KYC37404.1 hypothetical protein WA1_48275 [Scytonema hofmannii PCC 7110]